MASARIALRLAARVPRTARPLSSCVVRFNVNHRKNDTQEAYEKAQKDKPLNPHMTNTNSTIANEMPSVGKDSVPPELISAVEKNFVPKDSNPENTDRMTGGTQKSGPSGGANAGLDVGEIEGAAFKVEPLRRTGEDIQTMRARLTYQSRKRGILETDLLLSTFANENLGSMNMEELRQYDLFLDENDWDIYYWVTQETPPTSKEYAEGAGSDLATKPAQGKEFTDQQTREPGRGEWAQTVGTFKPAYRPVPQRWKDSAILNRIIKHVVDRSAGGIGGKKLSMGSGSGLGRMPDLKPV